MVSYSPNLRLIEPTPLDPATNNVWGTQLNIDFTCLDTAIAGVLALNVAGNANIILTFTNGSTNQSLYPTFVLTGVLTGSITIFWPNGVTRNFAVRNATTGAFTVTLAVNNGSGSPAGSTAAIVQGASGFFYSDGTNVIALGSASSATAGGDLTGTYPNPTIKSTVRVLQRQVFLAGGTFPIPATAGAGTVFRFITFGAGGAGGGATSIVLTGGGGGSGGGAISEFYGFTPSTNVTIAVGTAGAPSAGANGGTGGTSTVTYNAVTIVSCTGGQGGGGNSGVASGVQGQTGAATVTAGASGLTLLANSGAGAQPGMIGNASWSGPGGGNSIGTAGYMVHSNQDVAGVAGTFGAGGSGGAFGTTNQAGGAGGTGIVIVEWVL